MKVAVCIPQFYPYIGGAEVGAHKLAEGLVAKGVDVTLISTVGDVSSLSLPYKVIMLSKMICPLLRRIPFIGKMVLDFNIKRLQRKYRFDLWHFVMGYPVAAYGIDVLNRLGVRSILECVGEDIQVMPEMQYGYRYDPVLDRFLSKQYLKFNRVIAKSATIKEEYLQMGINGASVSIIPNGIDYDRYFKILKTADRRQCIRAEFGIPEDAVVILTVGRNHPSKGYSIIPLIAKEIFSKYPECYWIIAGKGVGEIKAKNKELNSCNMLFLEDLKSDDNAFSLPPEQLIELYCIADIFFFPSRVESFGMVILEAAAGHNAIVASDLSAFHDFINSGKNGMLFPVGDYEKAIEQLLDLISCKEAISSLAERASGDAKRYDWNCVIDDYIKVYNN